MKILRLLLFWLFSSIYLSLSAQDANLDKFVSDVFNTISKGNYGAFQVYTVKKEDYPELNAKQNFKTETARKNALANADSLVKRHQNSMKEYFEKVQKNAKNAGLSWTDCQYKGYRVINKTPLKNGYKWDIALQFTYKGIAEYEIHLNDCYQLKKGWIIWKAIGGPW